MPEFTSKDYIVANGSDVLMAPLSATDASLPTATFAVTTSAITNINATSIAVAALTAPLYESQRIRFGGTGSAVSGTGGQVVQLTADAAVAATSIAVKPVTASIPSAAIANAFTGLVPLYSARSASTNVGEDTITARNFKSGDWVSNSVIMRNWTIPVSGTVVKGDPGYALLATRGKLTGLAARVFVEVREPNGLGEYGAAYIQGLERSRETDNYIELSVTFLGDGKLYDIAADV